MDYVQPEEKRDVQAALLHGEMLHPIYFFGIRQPQDGADLTMCDGVIRRTGYETSQTDSCGKV